MLVFYLYMYRQRNKGSCCNFKHKNSSTTCMFENEYTFLVLSKLDFVMAWYVLSHIHRNFLRFIHKDNMIFK